jgi:hypothetical protein
VPASGLVHPLRTVLWDDGRMSPPMLPSDPSSPLRRRLLRAALLAPVAGALATLPGCSLPEQVDGTFLQPWRSHLQWGMADWQRSLQLARKLGCRQLVLQWTGISGGADGDWELPDTSIRMLFTAAAEAGIAVRVGLPFQQHWWKAIGADDATLQAFFADSLAQARSWLARAPWARLQAFNGWYVPYELEQYHWADPARQQWLAQWLHGITQAGADGGANWAISCYFSRLATDGNLVTLWDAVLAQADGAGRRGRGRRWQRTAAAATAEASARTRRGLRCDRGTVPRTARREQRRHPVQGGDRRRRAYRTPAGVGARQRCRARAGVCTRPVAVAGHTGSSGLAQTLGDLIRPLSVVTARGR